MKNFKQGDIIVASWDNFNYGNHARNITGYDPVTKTVTYHDPYHAGVDLKCSLEEFLFDEPMLRVVKR